MEDGLDGAGVYIPRLRPRYLACGPQTPECQRLISWFLGETSEAVHGCIFAWSAWARRVPLGGDKGLAYAAGLG